MVFMLAGRSSVAKMSVCLTCGDKGDTQLLICCLKCDDSLVHKYCMDEISFGADINWTCWECASKVSEAEPFRKSERISSRIKKAVEVRFSLRQRLSQSSSKKRKRSIRPGHGIAEGAQMTTKKHKGPDDARTAVDGPLPSAKRESLSYLAETQSSEEIIKRKQKLMFDIEKDSDTKAASIALHSCYSQLSSLTSLPSSAQDDHQNIRPLSLPIWRGYFNIKGTCTGIFGHLSSSACLNACEAAAALPLVLDVAILSHCDVWPKSFAISPPTAGNIGLYFFPENERAEKVFDGLLDNIIEHNLALKAVIGNVELLIFSSCELPVEHWRFRRKYFLWGVFRKMQRSFPIISSPNMLPSGENAADSTVQMRIQEGNEVSHIETATTWLLAQWPLNQQQ